MNKSILDLQIACPSTNIPKQREFDTWAQAALINTEHTVEICIRIVDEAESQQLNKTYRKKNKPTNVLSFPYEADDIEENDEITLLGDLAICAPIVEQEAKIQHKNLDAHWAHMTVHGILHLQGFDHNNDKEAEIMETLETEILNKLGFPNPYHLAQGH